MGRLNKRVKTHRNKNLFKKANIKTTPLTSDPIVNNVIDMFIKGHNKGMKKFGKTMRGNNKSITKWINDAQEEARDLILYLEKIKEKL